MNTTNNTESTVSTPPLSKNDLLHLLSIAGGGGAIIVILCGIVYLSEEDQFNAGWTIGFYGGILLWCGVATYAFAVACAVSPIVVGYSVKELVARAPGLLTLSAPKRPELAPGLSIAPDDLIRFDSPEETPEQFAAKIKTALHTKGRHYLFIFPRYTTDCVVVRKPTATGEVTEVPATRHTLPWVKVDEWTQAPHDIEHETWPEYEADLNRAVTGYRTWVAADKMTHAPEGGKALALAEALTRTAQVFAFVLLSAFTLQAQPKSAQVAQYVGPENFQKIKITGAVVFRFQKLPIERTARAQTLAQILSDARTYSDEDNAGKLQEITLNGTTIPRVKMAVEMPDLKTSTRAEIEKFMRSSTRYANAADTTKIPTMPSFESLAADSLTIAGNMNAATQKVERWKRAGWAAALPVWKFFMYLFGSVFGILLCLGGLCWYVADSATDETYIGYRGQTYTGKLARSAHESAAGWLLLITWTCFIVLLINVFLWLVYAGLDMWLVVVIWFIVLAISSKITKKIVPNIKRLSGETGVRPA